MNQRVLLVSFAALSAASFGWAAGCSPAPSPPPKEPETGKAVSPPQTVTCPEGKVLKGLECVAAAPEPKCPEGQVEKDGQCAPAAQGCPSGTKPGADGKTCVVIETPDMRKAADLPASPCPAGMALVKGGTYKMAFLKLEATVADVCLDLTEATTKDYESCVTAGKCNANFVDACTETTTYKKPGKEDHPMVCIDFNQAEAYCKFQNKRLPTEEEWEWAARGGAEARPYSWGSDAPGEQACWSGKGVRTGTCPVKAHPGTATPDGLLGMSGNVFEWTTSKNDSKGKDRVGRGGSWRDGLANLLNTGRPGRFEVTYRCGFLGVRCAAEPQQKK